MSTTTIVKPSEMVVSPLASSRVHNLAGKIYGRLTVEMFAGIAKGKTYWWCSCSCGIKYVKAAYARLRLGQIRSCGCYQLERIQEANTRHGETVGGQLSPEYGAYVGARQRCCQPSSTNYQHYGGRGIEFRFRSFDEFLAHVGRKPSSRHSIDRIDVNGHYEPGNIRWATTEDQGNNKRNSHFITADGCTLTTSQWARKMGCGTNRIYMRLKNKWCEQCAVVQPVGGKCLHRRK